MPPWPECGIPRRRDLRLREARRIPTASKGPEAEHHQIVTWCFGFTDCAGSDRNHLPPGVSCKIGRECEARTSNLWRCRVTTHGAP